MESRYEIQKYLGKEQFEKFPVIRVKAGETFFFTSKEEKKRVYYILEGVVNVFSISYAGREFLIDQLTDGDFVGKFSQMRGIDFQCEVKVGTDLKLLDISEIGEDLWLAYSPMGRFFHYRVSDRVYKMYKMAMMRMHFGYEEVFAYWLLKEQKENNVLKSEKIFLKMNVSDRQIYYLLKKFKELGLIEKKKGQIRILNEEKLQQIAENVVAFMED